MLSLFATLCISSCSSQYYESYLTSFGTVTGVSSSDIITIDGDSGATLELLASNLNWDQDKIGSRVYATFISEDDTDDATYIKGTLITLEELEVIQPIVQGSTGYETPDLITSKLGGNYISPDVAWFGGKFLNFSYVAAHHEEPIDTYVNVLVDPGKTTATEVYATFYFRGENYIEDNTNFEYYCTGIVNFDFTDYIADDDTVVTFFISYINIETMTESLLRITSDNNLNSSNE